MGMPTSDASAAVQWLAGDTAQRELISGVVGRVERDDGVEWLRKRDQRRRLARVPLADGRSLFVKHYLANDRHALRDAWKERLGLATADREWRTLVRLHAARLPVPAPLAHVRIASGEHVVVMEWIDGVPLATALADAAQRRPLLAALAALVRKFHEAGWVHRDLHRENVLVADGAPVLIDLQAARRSRSDAARLRDLGRLDHSLRQILSRGDRVRLRAAVLGARRPLDAQGRARVRAVGLASLARARAHAISRSQRSLRAGRRAQALECAGGRGLVSRAFDPAAVIALLAAPAETVGYEVRRYRASPRDLWRGSAARRAWAIAHALEASDLACVTPVAFLEWRRLGIAVRSLIVLADECDARSAAPPGARAELLARLDEACFGVRGLEARDIDLCERAGRTCARVLALEKLRFPTRRARGSITSPLR
jgi:tRNA A-37 threonylcarbamoyl transferase component Bud32